MGFQVASVHSMALRSLTGFLLPYTLLAVRGPGKSRCVA
ncbi:hypothetical protein SFR_6962 (plasmid) [Streptomyces sp. FR-008]|nr:hypothetical protein SFR_6962 [Streptomyces sp. FR-008]